MSKPWERHRDDAASQAPAGPWTRLAAPEEPPAPPQALLSGELAIPREMFNLPGPFGPLGVAAGRLLDPEGRRVDVPVPEGVEAAAIGAGRGLTRFGRGILDIGARVMGDEETEQQLRETEAEEGLLYQPLAEQHRGATLAGEVAPYMAAMPLGAPAGLLGTMGLGAGISALEYQPELSDRATAAAMGAAGGAVGHGLGRLAGRVLGGRATQLEPAMEARARAGEQMGFRLTPGARTGSRAAQKVEAALESNPLTSPPMSAIRESNQTALNRVVGQALGLGDDVKLLTEDKIDDAVTAIGRQFDDALGDASVTLDDAFAGQLDAIEKTYQSTWGRGNKIPQVIEDARREMAESGGQIAAERYKQLQTMLREEAKSAIKGQKADSALGRAIFAVKDALDDAASRSLDGPAFQMFRDAQAKWRAWKMLGSALNTDTGNVSGRILANTLRREDPSGYMRGQNVSPMYQAARFAKAFSPQIGDSGTATRQSLTQLGQMMLGGGAGGTALGFASDYVDPETGAALGLLAPLLMRGGSSLYASKLAERGLLGLGRSEAGRRVMGAMGGGLLSGASGAGGR